MANQNPGQTHNRLDQVDERIEEIAAAPIETHQIAERQGKSSAGEETEAEAAQTGGEIE